MKDCLNKSYDFHNSVEDVKSLGDLLASLSQSLMFLSLVADKILTNAMAKRIAGSGLNLHQIRLIHARGGYDGLHSVLSSKSSNGRSVVTASKKVLRTLSNYLEKK